MNRIIYILINDEQQVHYVGKTKNVSDRKAAHKKKYPNSTFEIIDEIPTTEWKFWERHYISLYRTWGFILDNKKLYAGNGCDTVSEETRKKMSAARIGNPNAYKAYGNSYMKGKIGYMKDKHHSEEAKKKMSDLKKGKPAPNKGKKMSEEFRKKVSDGKKGKPSSFKNKTHSEDSKLKMSESKKGKQIPWNKGLKLKKI